MSGVDTLERLIRHCTWANHAWVQRLEDLPDEGRLHELMSHILLSEQVWFQRVSAEPLDADIWRVLPTAAMRVLCAQHGKRFASLAGGDRDRQVAYRRFSGEQYQSPVSDILLHLCLHGTHHRGQMARYAAEHTVAVPNTDFVNFCLTNGL